MNVEAVFDGLSYGALFGLFLFGILIRIDFGISWHEFWQAFKEETRE